MSYQNVTEAIWQCVKATSEKEHGTQYDCDATGDQCTATTSTVVGSVVLSCQEDSTAQTLTYSIVKKPSAVPESTIWSGCEKTLRSCGWSG